MDSLANMVQEYLYTGRDDKEPRGYRLDGIIKLYDFMSLEIFFIKPMLHSLGKSAIKGYIDDLCQQRYTYEHSMVIEYENNEHDLLVCNASDKLIIPLLWTAYVYANTRYLIEKDEDFKNATSMFYDLMMEKSYYDQEYTKELPPLKYTNEAILMLLNHIRKSNEKLKEDEKVKDKRQTDNDEKAVLLDRIKKLESEHKEEMDSMIMELLIDICEGNKDDAQSFLDKVRGASDIDIPIIVKQFKNEGKIAKNRSNHAIWIVLHAAKLYDSSESNFNTALRKHS